jgi:hypothetical protein
VFAFILCGRPYSSSILGQPQKVAPTPIVEMIAVAGNTDNITALQKSSLSSFCLASRNFQFSVSNF